MLIGLVGKPSCGKSTFFKAATLANVEIASYPFTTIKPNHGIGYVRVKALCKELKTKCSPRTGFCSGETRFVPIELMDVAGLISGASKGKGLGNQFLDDLRQADLFIHIVDVSGTTDSEGKECEPGGGNPSEDVKMLENELDLWYMGILKKAWKSFTRALKNSKADFSKAVAKQFSGLKVKEDDVKAVLLKTGLKPDNSDEWKDDELRKFANELRHLTKPMIIAANKIDKSCAKENFEKLKKEFPDLMIIPCSADSELALREASKAKIINYIPGERDFKIKKSKESKISEKQKQALHLIKKNVFDVYGNTGVQQVLDKAVFDFLDYIAVFPVAAHNLTDSKGNVLPDCFLVPAKTTALEFAYHVHTDLGDRYVKAIDAKTRKPIGKDSNLKHRDVIEIVIN
jgi:hypothetical protein